MKIAGVEISNPDKIIYPKLKITKLTMVQYYYDIAEKMLPYLNDRPLTLQRFPDGISEKGFYQKNASDYFPDFIKTIKIPTEKGENKQIYCNTRKSLVYLANQGTISFHTWLAKRDQLNKPDKIVFDLDPSDNKFTKVKEAAKIICQFLKEKDIDLNIMTTGQHGLHLWYKIRRTKDFDSIRKEIKKIADELAEAHPELLTTEIRKNKRGNRIFMDYLRNSYAQTAICPYSLRPNEQAGIATPISLKALDNLKSADEFTLSNFLL